MDGSRERAPLAGRTSRSAADDAIEQATAIGTELRALIAATARATDILTTLTEELVAEARERRRHLRQAPAGDGGELSRPRPPRHPGNPHAARARLHAGPSQERRTQ